VWVSEVENTAAAAGEGVDDWTLIGDPCYVRDGIQRYQETLGHDAPGGNAPALAGACRVTCGPALQLLAETLAATCCCKSEHRKTTAENVISGA